jgi:hypothetical protein
MDRIRLQVNSDTLPEHSTRQMVTSAVFLPGVFRNRSRIFIARESCVSPSFSRVFRKTSPRLTIHQ